MQGAEARTESDVFEEQQWCPCGRTRLGRQGGVHPELEIKGRKTKREGPPGCHVEEVSQEGGRGDLMLRDQVC